MGECDLWYRQVAVKSRRRQASPACTGIRPTTVDRLDGLRKGGARSGLDPEPAIRDGAWLSLPQPLSSAILAMLDAAQLSR